MVATVGDRPSRREGSHRSAGGSVPHCACSTRLRSRTRSRQANELRMCLRESDPEVVLCFTAVQEIDASGQPIRAHRFQHRIDSEVFRAYIAGWGLSSTKQLTPEQLDQCLSEIDTRQAEAFQPTDDTERQPASQATRTTLAEALATLQGELEQAKEQGALDQLDTDWLDKLAPWAPVVKTACESPETSEAELSRYLQDTHQVLRNLRQMLTTEAAA